MALDTKTGKLTQKSIAQGLSEGAKQPRDLIFHPKMNIAHSTQERLSPAVATWNSETGELKLMQDLLCHKTKMETLPTADLHMSPDNKFLYASLRDKKSKLDAILLYQIQEDGSLKYVDRFACENIPRSFYINQTGDYLYVAGQKAEMLGVYKINKETGYLTKVTQYETGKAPIWVETLSR